MAGSFGREFPPARLNVFHPGRRVATFRTFALGGSRVDRFRGNDFREELAIL